jgi:putative FmdB family regulatory protein
MPTYGYVCEKCGHEFDVFQSMMDKPLLVCPKELCVQKRWGKGKVKRQLGTGAGIIFKGSGFYITDYRSSNYKEGAKKDHPVSSGSSAPASGESKTTAAPAKSESKPATPAKPST